jgi:hypothetical protein
MNEILRRVITYVQEQYVSVLTILGIVAALNYYIVTNKLEEQAGNAILVKLSSDQSSLINSINFLTSQLIFANKTEFDQKKPNY